MGNSQAHVSVGEKTMYQVTQVTRLSPGAECGLQAGEDHLVAMNGRQLKGMSLESMMEIIKVGNSH